MRKKLGLALGAGGARGIAHIGFLQALCEADLRPDYVTGCSMGAVIGACYCADVPMQTLRAAASKLRLSDIASLNLAPFRSNGLMNFRKARKYLTAFLGEKTFSDLSVPFVCVATDLEAGVLRELSEGSVVDAVLASSSIPGAVTPALFGGVRYVDGGILERVPTPPLRRMGAEVVVAVDVLGDLTLKRATGRLVDTVLRCIDIMDTRATMRKRRARRKSVDLWLEPALGGMDQYKVRDLDFAYEKGYELGKENAAAIAALTGQDGSV